MSVKDPINIKTVSWIKPAVAILVIVVPFFLIVSCAPDSTTEKSESISGFTDIERDKASVIPADTLKAYQPVLAGYREILKAIDESESSIVVVNFWATWCAPCIEEFPLFLDLREKYLEDGIDVLFVSVDFEDEVLAAAEFLYERRVNWRSFLATGDANEFIMAFDPEWTGSVPTTLVYDNSGNRLETHIGRVSYDELVQLIEPYLTQP